MNTPNPLVPQGALPQGTPGKFNIRLVVFGIIAAHSLFFCGLLIQGCSKPKEEAKAKAPEPALPPLAPPPADPISTGAPPAAPLAPPAVATGIAPAPLAPPAGGPAAPVTASPLVAPMAPVTTTPAIEPTPSLEGTKEHVVAKGESFYTIGKKYKVSASAIAKANPNVDSTKLKVGQKLQIPAGGVSTASAMTGGASAPADSGNVYVVKSGDNLGKIATKHGTTVKALRELNGLKADRINVGQKLKVPSKGGSSPSSIPVETAPLVPPVTTSAIPAIVPTAPAPGR